MQLSRQQGDSQEGLILPCTFQPGEGELLSSWLVRLAHAHQVKVHSFCRYLWPDTAIWNRDVDKLAPLEVLHTLATRTLTSINKISRMTLVPVIENLTGAVLTSKQAQAPWLMPLGIYHRTHRSQGLVYCPRCLQRDGSSPYYRTDWRLAFHVVCPTCGIYLQEGCPACGKPVNFFRIELGRKSSNADRPISTCYQCAFDLSQSSVRFVAPKALRRYRALYRISRQGWNQAVPYPNQYFRVLRQIIGLLTSHSKRVTTLQVDMRLRLNQPVEWPASWISFEKIPVAGRIYLLDQAMWLLTEWPDRFIAVMRYHRINSTSLLRDMSGEVPFWFDTIVNEHFYITNINRRFAPPLPERSEKGRNQLIAPIKGLAGCPRKEDDTQSCPYCHSHWISRNGFRVAKQRYECQQCRRHFTDTATSLLTSPK